MAVEETFRDYVLDQLSELGHFETKNMFGGVALLRGGSAFAKIKHGTVWLKADDRNRQDFLDAGMPQYTYGKDGSRTLNFYEIPGEVLEDSDEFVEWAKRSIQAASRK
jgi:DNA transformation protein